MATAKKKVSKASVSRSSARPTAPKKKVAAPPRRKAVAKPASSRTAAKTTTKILSTLSTLSTLSRTEKAPARGAARSGISGREGALGLSAHPDADLNKAQLRQLYDKLLAERERVMSGLGRHINEATTDTELLADEVDVAQRHTDQAYLIRFADKERKLLLEIEHALDKLHSGEYGVCEGTAEPIAFKRLELRPWTRYSVEYKEQLERERAQHA